MQETAISPLDARFARQRALPGFGEAAQARLAAARVLVIGAGGLGSAVIPALAGAGIGTIGIVDSDTVEESNLHRQTIHGTADIGRSKVDSAADSVAVLSPDTRVERFGLALDADNALELFGRFDLVLDGSDNFPTRYLANDAAELLGLPLVWGAISQYGGQASASHAPETPSYRDVFPSPPAPGAVLSCEVGGVLPTVCATIGAIMATEAIKIITGIGEPLYGRVSTFGALSGTFRELAFGRDPEAAPITGLADYAAFCGLPAARDEISPTELAALLGRVQLVDVREPWETELARIPGALIVPIAALPLAIERAAEGVIEGLDPEVATVVFCHHGIRSANARETLAHAGFGDVRHLKGGIDAWSRFVAPDVPRY